MAMTGGADSSTVNFNTGSGVLAFKTAPDYEAPTDANLDRIYLITIQGTDPAGNVGSITYSVTITNLSESSVVTAPTVAGTPYKGVQINLTMTSNVAGKVRFFVDGKKIPNCLAITTTGSYPNFTATCPWKPAVTSRHTVTAAITPTDNTFSSSTSAGTSYFVLKRSTTR
jgi:hypothetical protein